ncbi:AMP-binding protein [Aerosakkonema funiforme]|uniref:AMP-binding protein n=3 Tax=Oscillatoriophycideae TaxID=1301283 RepID=A0A926ZKR2_9CYAN|nr:AMP-binding protein [Aerosakkonema funiforme FACHB-1375]
MNPAKQPITVAELIQVQAQNNPDRIAIVAPKRASLTYGGLRDRIDQTATILSTLGINPNDRVAVVLPNGPEMAVAFLAIAATATCAPLNPAYREQEFDFYLSDLNPKALVIQPGVGEPARIVAKQRGIPIIELFPQLEAEAGSFSLISENLANPTAQIQNPESHHIALVLHTSGTTSRPKIVPLTHSNLCTSASNIRQTLNLSESDRCLNIMPLFHIHGLIAVLLSSLYAGASIVCSPGFYAPQFFSWIEEFQPTWYSAVPTMHQSILAQTQANREIISHSKLRFIRSSSASLAPQIMAQLEATFNVPVIEAYGMTEASHQMASNPLPPKERKPGSVGVAAGPEIAIMNETGHLLSIGEIGEVAIKGANVTQGYENNPKANTEAFTNGWFRTGDLGYLDDDGYLFLKGRIKEIINRAGEKISPREVDEVLLEHPAVAQALTFAAPHTLLGEDVAAAVVLKEGITVSELEIKEFVAQKLADFKVPRVVLFLDEIPKGPTGKLQRIGLAEKLGLTASNPTADLVEYAPPQTINEIKLAEIWSQVLKIEKIGIHNNFFQLGGDSILAAQIVNRVREAWGVELSFLIFFQQPTVANMAIEIAQIQAESLESEELDDLLANIESLSEEESQNLLNE